MKQANFVQLVLPHHTWQALIILALMASRHQDVSAATKTWNGSSSANWNLAANWTGGSPANGDDVVFPSVATRYATSNDFAALKLNSLIFAGSNYVLHGNAIALTNGLVANHLSGGNTNYCNITLDGPQTFHCLNAGANLALLGNVTLGANTLTVSNAGTVVCGSVISGNGGVTKAGGGSLIYSGASANTYTGATFVKNGALELAKSANNGGIGDGSLIIGDNVGAAGSAVVRESVTFQIQVIPITINGDGLLDLNNVSDTIGSTLTLNDAAAIQTGAGLLTLGPDCTVNVNPTSGTATVNGRLGVGSSTCVFNVGIGWNFSVDAMVSGSATITKTGPGSFYLKGSNSFTGELRAQDGLLGVGNSWALGTTNGGVTLSNGVLLAILGNSHVGLESLSIYNTNADRTLFSYSGSNSWAGNIHLAVPATVDVATNCWLSLSGGIFGRGGMTKIGPGTLTFSGLYDNTYLGDTRIFEGVLELNKSPGALAIYSDGGVVIGDGVGGDRADVLRLLADNQLFNGPTNTVESSGLFDLNNRITYAGPFVLKGGDITLGTGILAMNTASRGLTVSNSASAIDGPLGKVLVTAPIAFNVAPSVVFDVQSPVSGAGGILKSGTGTLRLGYPGDYTGLTLVQQGYLDVYTAASLGAAVSGTVVSNGATLQLREGVIYTNEPLVLNGGGMPGYGTVDVDSGTTEWGGPVTLNANSEVLPYNAAAVLKFSGAVGGPGGITKAGIGTLVLQGTNANTYAGVTRVNGGKLRLAKPAWTNAVPGPLIVGDGAGGVNADTVEWGANHQVADTADVIVSSSGSLFMPTNSEVIGSLAGAGNLDLGTSGALYFGGNPTNTVFSGAIGGGSIFKGGWSTVTLTGTNTSPGFTYAMVGALLIDGYQPLRPVWVGTVGTLGGTGTVGTITADVGGVVAPGISPGILISSNLTFTGAGQFRVELNGTTPGTGYDQLRIRGSVTLGNASLDASLGFQSALSNSFTIVDNDGSDAVTNTFSGLPEGATVNVSGTPFRISYAGGSGNDVVLTQLAVMQRPVLNIAFSSGTNVVVSWPTNSPDWLLHATTNLVTGGGVWTEIPPPYETNGTNLQFTEPVPLGNKFYRLHKP